LIEKNKNAFEPVYAALIETLDYTIGILVKKLEELNLLNDTIIVFTSDNGGLHVPEGNHSRVTHNTPFRAGKGYTYEGGQRVPLIVRWPEHIPSGRVIDVPVNNTDWIPTLLELIGAEIPKGLDGVSFAKELTGGKSEKRKIFWHFPHYTNQGGRPSGAVRDGDWLYIEFYDTNTKELYDLSVDIGEKEDLSARYPEIVNSLHNDLEEWKLAIKAQSNKPNPECIEDDFRNLYINFDPSSFNPLEASDEEWDKIRSWRIKMDEAVNKKRIKT